MFSQSEKEAPVMFGKEMRNTDRAASEELKTRFLDTSFDSSKDTKVIRLQVDYMKSNSQYVVAHFVLECCKKLEAKCITTATACSLFHKFFIRADTNHYDPYLIGAASIYLAGKIEDDQLRLRDVINTVHATLHRTLDTLALGDEYWNMRDAIVQAELFLLRMVEFKVHMTHPHKYLLHYLTSVRDWMDESEWLTYPIPKTAWSILQDLYHDSYVTSCDPSMTALGILQLTLEIYGIQLPLLNGIEADRPWFKALNLRATKERIWDVMTKCLSVYSKEREVLEALTTKSEDPNSAKQITIE